MNQRKAGVVISYISLALNSLVGFIYIPMLIHFLTTEQYGLYQLIGSIIAYFTLIDWGIGNTVTRYYVDAGRRGDVKAQENVLGVSGVIYGVLGAVILLAGIVCFFFIDPVYGKALSADSIIKAKQIYLIMLLNVTVTTVSNIFAAVINANEKFIFARSLTLFKIGMQPVIVWAVLSASPNVIALVVAQTLFNFAVIGVNIYYCLGRLKARFAIHSFNMPFVKELLLFSVFIMIHIIMDQIFWRSGMLVLGAVAGTAAVAVFSVGLQISSLFLSVSSSVSGIFLPRITYLYTQGEGGAREVDSIFIKTGRLQFYLAFWALSGFILLGRQFLRLWVGADFDAAYLAAALIMAGYFLDVIQNAGISILQAKNKHSFRAYLYIIMTVVNFIVCIPLAKYYGLWGCAAGMAFCLLLFKGFIINVYYVKIGLDIKTFFSNVANIFPPCFFAFAAGYFTFRLTGCACNCLVNFLLCGTLYTLLFGAVIWIFAFNKYEKELVKAPLRKLGILKA